MKLEVVYKRVFPSHVYIYVYIYIYIIHIIDSNSYFNVTFGFHIVLRYPSYILYYQILSVFQNFIYSCSSSSSPLFACHNLLHQQDNSNQMNLNNIVYFYLWTLTSKTLEVTTFFVGLASCENLSEALPCEPPPRFHYESFVEHTAHWELHLHFTTFKKWILIQKTDIGKTAWINPCYEEIDTQLEGFYHWRKNSIKTFPCEK